MMRSVTAVVSQGKFTMTRKWICVATVLLFASSDASAQVVWGLWGFPTGASNHARIVTFPANAPQTFTVIGETGFDVNTDYPTGLDFDGVGSLYVTGGTNSNFLYSVNKTTGATALIGGSGLAANRFVSDLLRGKRPKLSDKQHKELWRMYETGEYSINDLAELFAVSRPTVYRALARKTPRSAGS
jgi:hypothetical protein